MILRRLARSTSGLTASSQWLCPSCVRTLPLTSRRNISVPTLNHNKAFSEEGVKNLLSAQAYRMAWTQYETMTIQKLNELTAGESFQHSDSKTLAMQFARDPMAASLFNYASMAHNNHFFFSGLSPEPSSLDKFPQLQDSLLQTFGSVETLKATFLDTAAAMFGPGFVWLIWARAVESTSSRGSHGAWRILTTYNAGTPYPEAGYRQQGLDMNNNNEGTYKKYAETRPVNAVGMFGRYSQQGQAASKLPPGSTWVAPVLCVSTWEHVYLMDYGVAGKRQFLSNWWDAIDWANVEQHAPQEAKSAKMEFLGGMSSAGAGL